MFECVRVRVRVRVRVCIESSQELLQQTDAAKSLAASERARCDNLSQQLQASLSLQTHHRMIHSAIDNVKCRRFK